MQTKFYFGRFFNSLKNPQLLLRTLIDFKREYDLLAPFKEPSFRLFVSQLWLSHIFFTLFHDLEILRKTWFCTFYNVSRYKNTFFLHVISHVLNRRNFAAPVVDVGREEALSRTSWTVIIVKISCSKASSLLGITWLNLYF